MDYLDIFAYSTVERRASCHFCSCCASECVNGLIVEFRFPWRKDQKRVGYIVEVLPEANVQSGIIVKGKIFVYSGLSLGIFP